jgi:hypothetical protein
MAGIGHTLAAQAALNYEAAVTGDQVVLLLLAVAMGLLVAVVAVGAGAI